MTHIKKIDEMAEMTLGELISRTDKFTVRVFAKSAYVFMSARDYEFDVLEKDGGELTAEITTRDFDADGKEKNTVRYKKKASLKFDENEMSASAKSVLADVLTSIDTDFIRKHKIDKLDIMINDVSV